MSTPIVTTGRTVATCYTCGQSVEHATGVSIKGEPITVGMRHDAPCGLPCIGGGVGKEVIKPMREAGLALRDVTHSADRCPRCEMVRP